MNQTIEETSKKTSVLTQPLDLERTIQFLSEHLVFDELLNKTSIRRYLSSPGYIGTSIREDNKEPFIICPTYEDKNNHINGIFISSSGISAVVGLIISHKNIVIESDFSMIRQTSTEKGYDVLDYILNEDLSKGNVSGVRGKIIGYAHEVPGEKPTAIPIGTFDIQSQNKINTEMAEMLIQKYNTLLNSMHKS